ncbi:OmpA family protein [Pragia fontium]|uniref:Outer membrane protein OmpA n=1 Tax=Pragia fontium DSM 5563 = ATCC 49100 TaxID=1122977 RepID=A0AAJ4W9J7_9GAMM|nr:OmpA family protein [Pragia fontium]SFC50533.1 Outer membrane protein OmpA [Pragia fontium DSM 5563 = ATCC 49100]
MGDYPWRVQLLYATCLCLALLLFFLPLPTGWVVIGCVLTLLVSGYKGWRTLRYTKQIRHVSPYLDALEQQLETLPERLRRRLPVILVTGNATAGYFAEQQNQHVVVTGKSIWIAVPDVSELSLTADALSGRWPEMAGRIGVLFTLMPEHFDSQASLTGYLQTFRQSWADASKTCGYTLPGYLAVNAKLGEQTNVPQWFWWNEQGSGIRLLDDCQTSLMSWSHQGDEKQRCQRQHLTVVLETLQQWLDKHVIQVLSDTQQPVPQWIPGAVACLNVNHSGVSDNCWRSYLRDITTLSLPVTLAPAQTMSLPERLVEQMPVYCPMSGKKRAICHALIFSALFAAIAMAASAYNNSRLLQNISGDLQAYNRIPMNSYDDKLDSLNVLKVDRALLDKYYRQGEPARLGVGLYMGSRLIAPLDIAIKSYQPPPPPPPPPPPVEEAPKVVRLDSMSLFDTGKSALKTGSTKVLVDALINIKAKPGWLILVSGHTDITGDPQRNQLLSLARAESVRDWMIETSDIDKTCFAIQGYGATQPIADNTTAEGRAANRRVEISLVPEASACQSVQQQQTLQQN